MQNVRLNFKKKINPSLVFNDENLEIQRFGLNVGMAKRSKKTELKSNFFFEILRIKNNGIEKLHWN